MSFSGGKDSTVLLDIVESLYPHVPAVFCDTGLEYPEVREHALAKADVVIRPSMTFKQVIDRYGYPVASKEQSKYIREYRHTKSDRLKAIRLNGASPTSRFKISARNRSLINAPFETSEKCCDVMKKRPFLRYEKETGNHPFIGTLADESQARMVEYMRNGCNAFDLKRPKSTPLGFWTENDILAYLVDRRIEIPSVYGEIVQVDLFGNEYQLTGLARTGCMFCMFGVHLEQYPNRFQRMKQTHPKQWQYCMDKLGEREVLEYIGVPYE